MGYATDSKILMFRHSTTLERSLRADLILPQFNHKHLVLPESALAIH